MAQRVIIGNDSTGRMLIRTSAAGYDAATAPLNSLLFDADACPGRILSSGEQYCHWYMYDWQNPGQSLDTVIPHYASGSFIVIAIAKAIYDDGTYPEDWRLKSRKIVNGVATFYYSYMGGPAKGNYVTPFYASGDYSGGHTYWFGWTLSWDNSNIIIRNWLANGLYIRWMVLEV